MYVRFFRWASDRLGEDGVVAFITNRSFIDAHTADGFRRVVGNEFAEGWVIDLGGDYKKKGVGGTGNVFDIGTGVAVSFWIKRKSHSGKVRLFYRSAPGGTGEDKLSWIANQRMDEHGWQEVAHRHDAAWMDVPNQNWDQFPPLAEKSSRNQKRSPNAIFRLFSLGIATNRDDWVYDKSKKQLKQKIANLVGEYDAVTVKPSVFPNVIKWSETLKRRKNTGENEATDWTKIRHSSYRPFEKKSFYHSTVFIDRPGRSDEVFPLGRENRAICFSDISPRAPFTIHSVAQVHDLNYGGSIGGFQHVPRYRYTKSGERVDNITDWAVAQFRVAYEGEEAGPRVKPGVTAEGGYAVTEADGNPTPSSSRPPSRDPASSSAITKDAIFAYCYAVLHDPVYREKYALNLKREFPRIPFYPDFARWVAWGEALLKLHIGYEDVTPFALTRTDTPAPKRAEGTHPKPKLKSIVPEKGDTESGVPMGSIIVDEDTQLSGIPRAAWDYRLGNRSAIDWVLDQHKEKTPRDPTIRAKFNTYRFADYKESMIALLARVVTVSIETVAITEAMATVPRNSD
jgi:predicted helicase